MECGIMSFRVWSIMLLIFEVVGVVVVVKVVLFGGWLVYKWSVVSVFYFFFEYCGWWDIGKMGRIDFRIFKCNVNLICMMFYEGMI